MNKKLLSMTLALSMVAAGAAAVMADDKAPTVYVDKSEIIFEDQEPVILGEGFTVVPVRGVFEAMGATVKWSINAIESKRGIKQRDICHCDIKYIEKRCYV